MSIRIFYDETDFRLKGFGKVKKLVEKVISNEKKISGDLNFIMTSERIIRAINKEFLKHNYYTDVISFDYSEKDEVNGEIYISVETVRTNAINYKVSYNCELLRVIIHGVLHLCGYEDRNDEEKMRMRKLEDFWLEVCEKGL